MKTRNINVWAHVDTLDIHAAHSIIVPRQHVSIRHVYNTYYILNIFHSLSFFNCLKMS
jgi:hypothetical protein